METILWAALGLGLAYIMLNVLIVVLVFRFMMAREMAEKSNIDIDWTSIRNEARERFDNYDKEMAARRAEREQEKKDQASLWFDTINRGKF